MSINCEPVPPGVVSRLVATGNLLTSAGCESGSRMSAPSPRPSAFLAISDYLPCELYVSFGTFTMNVVEHDWLPLARLFREPHVPRNYALEYLSSEKPPEIGRHLTR